MKPHIRTQRIEGLKNLPLLKGVAENELLNLLGKRNVQFVNYRRGETIVSAGDPVTHIRFLISGRVKLRFAMESGGIILSHIISGEYVFSPENLYGIDNREPFSVEAVESCTLMRITKEDYMAALYSSEVMRLSYLNYLSARAQRPVIMLRNLGPGTLSRLLYMMLTILTVAKSENIEVRVSRATIRHLTNISFRRVDKELHELNAAGLIEYTRNIIYVRSRSAFMDYMDSGL